MSDIQKYKDTQKRLTLMQVPSWVKTIELLKNFKFDKSKDYTVTYKEEKQRSNRNQAFHDVVYVEETSTFVFTVFVTDYQSSEVTDKIQNIYVLKDIDIINLQEKDKFNIEDYTFF